jgi:alkaline phosphatase D
MRTPHGRTGRRGFLWQVLAATAAAHAACGGGEDGEADGSSGGDGTSGDEPTGGGPPPLAADPFTLGISSGDPLPDSVILWTRLAPAPAEVGGGVPDAVYEVAWEVARDEAFAEVVASGTAEAAPMFGHSVHVDAQGLTPDTWYWFRFKVGAYTSPAGRTRTTPADDAQPERLRYATACCQDYRDGYYTPYAHMVKEDLDLVVFLGDYIYESDSPGAVRSHDAPEPQTLDEYRARYALYHGDADLRAALARCPWAVIWDDHEVENNYVGDISQDAAPTDAFRARKAAAYQAFYEHMPLRLPPPDGPDYKIYRTLRWGDLAEMWLCDTRQYRSDQTCDDEPGSACPEWASYDGTVLGDEQEAWLTGGLAGSAAIWKLIAQQVVFSFVNFGGVFVNFDQWDGYLAARQRLLDFLSEQKLANVVVLSGDLHVGGLGDLTAIADDEDSPIVAAEIVTTSISSFATSDAMQAEALVEGLELIRHFNATRRGYVSHEVTRAVYTARCFYVETVTEPSSGGSVEFELAIDAGTPGFRAG